MACGNLGTAYASQGKYNEAIDLFNTRLEIALQLSDVGGEGCAYGNLASAFCATGQFARAVELLEKDLAIARQLRDRGAETKACANLGAACLSLAQGSATRGKITDTPPSAHVVSVQQEGAMEGEGGGMREQEQTRNLSRALEMLLMSKKLAEETGCHQGLSTTLLNLGLAHLCELDLTWQACHGRTLSASFDATNVSPETKKRICIARECFANALSCAESETHANIHVQVESLLQLARLTYMQGQPGEALCMLKRHLDLVVGAARRVCGGCGQVRDGEAMLTCSGCLVARCASVLQCVAV